MSEKKIDKKLLENPFVGSLVVPIAIVLVGALVIFGVYSVCWFGAGCLGLWCLLGWTWVVEDPVFMVPARLDLGGRGYGVYGVWVSVVGLWCLWCLMVWA